MAPPRPAVWIERVPEKTCLNNSEMIIIATIMIILPCGLRVAQTNQHCLAAVLGAVNNTLLLYGKTATSGTCTDVNRALESCLQFTRGKRGAFNKLNPQLRV